jgi:hypothetical protein
MHRFRFSFFVVMPNSVSVEAARGCCYTKSKTVADLIASELLLLTWPDIPILGSRMIYGKNHFNPKKPPFNARFPRSASYLTEVEMPRWPSGAAFYQMNEYSFGHRSARSWLRMDGANVKSKNSK